MPTQTPNYNLTKPLKTENYNIDVFNNNADIIDSVLKNIDSQMNEKANNWLKGKTINFLGDSITAEEIGKITYVTRVSEMLECTCNNYAIGGRAFVGETGFWSMVSSMQIDADVNVIMGGVNDYLLGVPIGTKNSAEGNTTLYSALEKFANALINRCPNSMNVIITPLKVLISASEAIYSQTEVVKALYYIADKYNFLLIDLYSNAPNYNPNILLLKSKWCPDGIHPNQDYVDKFLGKIVAENLLGINNVGNSLLTMKDYCRMTQANTETVDISVQKDLVLYGNSQTDNNNMIATNGIKINKTGIYLLNVCSAITGVNASGNIVCGIALNGSLFLKAVFDFTNLASENKTLNLSHVIKLSKNDVLTIKVTNNTSKAINFTTNILTAIEQ